MFIRSKRMFIDGKLRPACISIHSGKIAGVHAYTYMKEMALDAENWLVLPGAIDAHVHMREPEAPHKEDFTSGSSAAIAGGVTSFIDMPSYRNPATTTVGALTEKERLASTKSVADFAFHFGATFENDELIRRLSPPSIKAFLSETKSPMSLSVAGLERHCSGYDHNKPICVHAEDGAMIEKNAAKHSKHEDIRPSSVEMSAVKKVADLIKKYKRRMHFCHLTTAGAVKASKNGTGKYKPDPLGKIVKPLSTCEVSPHHLFLSLQDMDKLAGKGAVNPPLRTRAEVAALWKSLKHVDMIASDHAPHLPDEKMAGSPGFPGVQTMVPLLLHAVVGGKLKIEEAVRLFASGPADAFTLQRKGRIAPCYDADLIIFDPEEHWQVSLDDLHSKCGWSPYEGWRLRGKIQGVFLRGEQVAWDNEILVKPGFGKPLQRALSIGSERLDLRKHAKERIN